MIGKILESNIFKRLNLQKISGKCSLRKDHTYFKLGIGKAAIVATMVFPGVNWQEASPESVGIDSIKLKNALNYLGNQLAKTGGISELVIVRKGYIIARGYDIDRKHDIWSVTKSFTSTALGLLIDDGKCTLDTVAKDYEPLLEEHYSGVTLRHFATMTAGYDAAGFSESHSHGNGTGDWGPNPYEAALPLYSPGTKFCYHDEAMFMFGRILTVIAEQSLHDLLKERITKPIGMGNWDWPQNGEVNSIGINQGCTGISISAKQLARWGFLFLNRGNWNGKQLISAAWIDQATRNQVPTSLGLVADRSRKIEGRGVYGYNWWLNGFGPDGKRKLPDVPINLYWASGFNNNVCFVIPDWNMVIVRLGTSGRPKNSTKIWNNFLKRIGESLITGQHYGG